MRIATLTAACAVALVSAACVKRTGDFTVMSTRTLTTVVEKARERTKGSSCSHWVLFGLIEVGEKNYKEAVDDALQGDNQYDALVDVVTYDRKWGALLYGQNCFVIEGTRARIGPRLDLTVAPVKLQMAPVATPPNVQPVLDPTPTDAQQK